MEHKKILTYVTPKINLDQSLCGQLPITVKPVKTVEELFPLLSDSKYHTDFIVVSVDIFHNRKDSLDVFDIIHTLSILIKSTVNRTGDEIRTSKRSTKIFVVVNATTNVKLVKEIMKFPDIAAVVSAAAASARTTYIYLILHLSTYLSIYLSNYLSIYPSIIMYLPIFLPLTHSLSCIQPHTQGALPLKPLPPSLPLDNASSLSFLFLLSVLCSP